MVGGIFSYVSRFGSIPKTACLVYMIVREKSISYIICREVALSEYVITSKILTGLTHSFVI